MKRTEIPLAEGADVAVPADDDSARFLAACRSGSTGLVGALLRAGVRPNAVASPAGELGLHLAVAHGHVAVADQLLGWGADVNAPLNDTEALSPLQLAIRRRRFHVAELLLLREDVDVNYRDREGGTALAEAVVANNRKIADLLLSRGASTRAAKLTWSPLHMASYLGFVEIADLLLQKSASVKTTTSEGATALHVACRRGCLSVVQLLIKRAANVNTQDKGGMAPIHVAAYHGFREIVEILIVNGAKLDLDDKFGCTPLHYAASRGSLSCVVILLANHAKADKRDKEGWLPVHEAAESGFVDIVQTLCQACPSTITAATHDGTTILHHAVTGRHEALAAHLLAHTPALAKAKDRWGQTPVSLCHHHTEMAAVLASVADTTSPLPPRKERDIARRRVPPRSNSKSPQRSSASSTLSEDTIPSRESYETSESSSLAGSTEADILRYSGNAPLPGPDARRPAIARPSQQRCDPSQPRLRHSGDSLSLGDDGRDTVGDRGALHVQQPPASDTVKRRIARSPSEMGAVRVPSVPRSLAKAVTQITVERASAASLLKRAHELLKVKDLAGATSALDEGATKADYRQLRKQYIETYKAIDKARKLVRRKHIKGLRLSALAPSASRDTSVLSSPRPAATSPVGLQRALIDGNLPALRTHLLAGCPLMITRPDGSLKDIAHSVTSPEMEEAIQLVRMSISKKVHRLCMSLVGVLSAALDASAPVVHETVSNSKTDYIRTRTEYMLSLLDWEVGPATTVEELRAHFLGLEETHEGLADCAKDEELLVIRKLRVATVDLEETQGEYSAALQKKTKKTEIIKLLEGIAAKQQELIRSREELSKVKDLLHGLAAHHEHDREEFTRLRRLMDSVSPGRPQQLQFYCALRASLSYVLLMSCIAAPTTPLAIPDAVLEEWAPVACIDLCGRSVFLNNDLLSRTFTNPYYLFEDEDDDLQQSWMLSAAAMSAQNIAARLAWRMTSRFCEQLECLSVPSSALFSQVIAVHLIEAMRATVWEQEIDTTTVVEAVESVMAQLHQGDKPIPEEALSPNNYPLLHRGLHTLHNKYGVWDGPALIISTGIKVALAGSDSLYYARHGEAGNELTRCTVYGYQTYAEGEVQLAGWLFHRARKGPTPVAAGAEGDSFSIPSYVTGRVASLTRKWSRQSNRQQGVPTNTNADSGSEAATSAPAVQSFFTPRRGGPERKAEGQGRSLVRPQSCAYAVSPVATDHVANGTEQGRGRSSSATSPDPPPFFAKALRTLPHSPLSSLPHSPLSSPHSPLSSDPATSISTPVLPTITLSPDRSSNSEVSPKGGDAGAPTAPLPAFVHSRQKIFGVVSSKKTHRNAEGSIPAASDAAAPAPTTTSTGSLRPGSLRPSSRHHHSPSAAPASSTAPLPAASGGLKHAQSGTALQVTSRSRFGGVVAARKAEMDSPTFNRMFEGAAGQAPSAPAVASKKSGPSRTMRARIQRLEQMEEDSRATVSAPKS